MSFREVVGVDRSLVQVWNAVEMESPGAGVYTRVMLARAERGGALPPAAKPIGPTLHDAT